MNKQSSLEDMALECNSYLKVKHFMSKRIQELEQEVESLKTEYLSQVSLNCELLSLLKIEKNLPIPKEQAQLQIPSHTTESLILNLNDNESCSHSNTFSYNVDEQVSNTDNCVEIKNRNIELMRENTKLAAELRVKNLKIKRVMTDKLIIMNELNELLISLRKVDIDLLNKFYSRNAKLDKDMRCYLGVKYNILSAQSTLSMQTETQLGKTELEGKIKVCESVLKSYQNEFSSLLNRNLIKKKLLDSSYTDN